MRFCFGSHIAFARLGVIASGKERSEYRPPEVGNTLEVLQGLLGYHAGYDADQPGWPASRFQSVARLLLSSAETRMLRMRPVHQ